MVDTSIVTTPENQFALIGSRVVLDCSTDLEYPMNWWHTPAGSDKSTEFSFLKGIIQTNEFYKTGFRVDTSIAGHHTVIIDNVTAHHAGIYDCYHKEGVDKIKASANLNVFASMPECEYKINDRGDSAITITIECIFAMFGNLKPQLGCFIQDHLSTHVTSEDVLQNYTNKTILTEVVSTNKTDRSCDLNITCIIDAAGVSRLPHILKPVKRHHQLSGLNDQCGDPNNESQYSLLILVTVVVVIAFIAAVVIAAVYFAKKHFWMSGNYKLADSGESPSTTPSRSDLEMSDNEKKERDDCHAPASEESFTFCTKL